MPFLGMTIMRASMLLGFVFSLLLGGAGCDGGKSVEGKVKIDSTEPFKKMKSTKPPPPQKPQQ